MVVIACKGVDHRIRENLSSFLAQDHPNYEVKFVVEDEDDPVTPIIREVIRSHEPHVRSYLIVAGKTESSGQKIHNLRAGTKDPSPNVQHYVFADSDACSSSSWLRWMTFRLGRRRGIGAKTGYRWMVPQDASLATMIVCSINNWIAAMLGPGNRRIVWGGSWGIHRQVFESLGIREAWERKLSDDLVASRALKNAKLQVKFMPQCMCLSEVRFNSGGSIEFLRRQFLITRTTLSHYWCFSVLIVFPIVIGFWGSLAAGLYLTSLGDQIGTQFLVANAALYALSIHNGMMRKKMGEMVSPTWSHHHRFHAFDTFAAPIVQLTLAACILLSMVGSHIKWRGIHYSLDKHGNVTLLGRDIDQAIWSKADTDVNSDVIPLCKPVTAERHRKKAA